MLLMALPNEHLLTFGQYKDVETFFEAIQVRFGGNDATKKTQKTLLKQMYKNFNALSTKSLDSIFNRLQKIASQLAILDLNTISIDDLHNNFKIVEHEVKRTVTTSSSSGYQNMAFLSSPCSTNEVDTTNIQVSTVNTPVSTVSTHDNTANLSDAPMYAFLANQPNGSQLVHEDLEQIHEDDLEEMDMKWQLALLSMRAKRYFQRTGKKITINGSDTVGYHKTKVECFKCHKMGHFSRECKSLKNQESRPRNQDSSRKTVNIEDTSSKAMVAIDGAGFDWSYMADDEAPINMALMDFSDSEGLDKLIGSQISDNSRTRLGFASYNVVAPPLTGLFTPLTMDLSNSGLAEFQHPEFKGYGPKASKSVCVDTLNEIKKAPNAPIIKDWVFDSDEDESEVMVLKSDNVQHKPEQANQPRKGNRVTSAIGKQGINVVKSSACWVWRPKIKVPDHISKNSGSYICDPQDALKDQGYFDSRCSRNMTGNKSYLTDFKEHDGGSKTINSIKQIHAAVDGKAVVISESSVRSDLLFDDEDGITCLTNDEIFENLALMGYEQLSTKHTFQKGGSPRCQETIGGTPAQTRSERVLEHLNESPLLKGHTSRNGDGRMEHTFELTDIGYYIRECTSRTKAVYHKAFITLTKRVKKLETQLKKKRNRAVIHSSDEEEPSLDIENSPKQGRMIGEIDKDKNVNLVNESTTEDKGKGIMQETELSNKIKKREMIQLSLDEELAQKLHAEELAKETTRQEQEKYNLEKALQLQKQLDQREEDVDKGDQTQVIDWNDPEVLRYHALQNRVFSKAKVRKNMCTYLKNQGGYKQSYFKGMKYEDIGPIFERIDEQTEEEAKAQVDTDQEVEEMKLYMKIVPDEEIAIDAIPLATKPLVIVEYNIVKEGKISTYHIIRADINENVNLVSEQGEVHETVEPLKDDGDATLAKTLLNIKRSTTKDKGKGIMQETELPNKIKKREMIQLSLDEKLPQKLHAEELAKKTARQEQEKYNLEKALELQKQLDQREEDVDKGVIMKSERVGDAIGTKSCELFKESEGVFPEKGVLQYKQSYFKGMKYEDIRPLLERINLQQEFSKKQKLDEQTEEEVEAQADTDQEVEEMKLYMKIVPDEEIAIDAIPLATKPPGRYNKIVKEGKISTYHIIRADVSTKRYTSMINLLENIDREDLETLWKIVKDKHGNTRPEEDYERVL
nr:hypothetical protein [Tanacetum cinerariifolium]